MNKNTKGLYILFALIIWVKCIYFGFNISDATFSFEELSLLSSIRILSTYAAFAWLLTWFSFLYYQRTIAGMLQLLLDLWLIANLMYYRSFHDLLSIWSWDAVGELQFYDGIMLPYLHWGDICMPILSLIWVVLSFCSTFPKHQPIDGKSCIYNAIITILLLGPWCAAGTKAGYKLNPFDTYYREVSMGRIWYATTFSPIAHGINEALELFTKNHNNHSPNTQITLYDRLQSKQNTHADANVIIVLFESLESWVVNTKIEGQTITPNINALINDSNTSYIKHIAPQVSMGKSSDAQLIILTGLLPVNQGVTAMRYMHNTFPSLALASGAEYKKIYIPTPASAWNQEAMTHAYGFDSLYAKTTSDRMLVYQVLDDIQKQESFFVLMTTMASHVPFKQYADSSSLSLPSHTKHADYLRTVHYTDQCLKPLIDYCRSTSHKPTLLVITGDHTTLSDTMSHTVPLIMYAPQKRLQTDDQKNYQIDIYPTLLQTMQCQDYYWQGVGVSWFDRNKERLANEQEVSNMLIMTDYFRNYQSQNECSH